MHTTATVKRMTRRGLHVLLGALSILTVGAQQAFLFAGQSNTIGHTVTQSSDPTKFQGILDILGDTSLTDNQKKARLETKFLEAEEADSDQAAFFAQYVMLLDKRGQMKDIETPIPNVVCSFLDPSGYGPGRHPSINVSPTSGCGSAFGTELMFAQTLVNAGEPWSTTNVEIAKVAQGGSKIYKDWVSPNAEAWEALNNTIHTTEGTWKAFVWHQGESDCFGGQDTSVTYETNLTTLIGRVQAEMHRATPFYASPADIPVVIVNIHWPSGQRYDRVVKANRNVAQRNSRTVLVETNDIGGFFHLNAVGLFVVGDRIAKKLAGLLSEGTTSTSLLTATDVSARWNNCTGTSCYFTIESDSQSSLDIYELMSIKLTWPLSPDTQTLPWLRRFTQGNTTLWKGRRKVSPTEISSGWRAETESNRQIGSNSKREFRIKFQQDPPIDQDVTKYMLEIALENMATQEATSLLI